MGATLLGEYGLLDNLDDTSGNSRHAFVSGGYTPTYVDGPQAGTRAVQFSASGQTITLGDAGLNPASIGVSHMGWVRFTAGTGGYLGVVVRPRAVNSTRYGCLAFNGLAAPRARWTDDLHFTDGGPSVADGAWHHLAVVDGNTRWAFYVDGVKFDSGVRSVTGSGHFEGLPWNIGFSPVGGVSDSIAGAQVSGVRIFHGELTDAEVVSWMNTPIVAPEAAGSTQPWEAVYVGSALAEAVYIGSTKVWPGEADYASLVAAESPLLWLKFDETSGTTAVDHSGNGRNGTYSGGPTLNQPPLFEGTSKSALFDTSNDDVVVTSAGIGAALGSGWTLEMIWECGPVPAGGLETAIFTNGYSTTVGASLRHAADRLRADFYNGSWRGGFGGCKPVLRRRYFLNATWDGSALKTYINGYLNFTVTGIGAGAAFSAASWIVNRKWDSGNYIGGKYGQAVIYVGAQSATKIHQRWEALSSGLTAQPWVPVLTNGNVPAGLAGWTSRAGTWTGDGTYGANQTANVTNALLEFNTNLGGSLRRIQATVRLPNVSSYCGFIFTNGGVAAANDFAVRLNPSLDTITTDSFGGSAGMITVYQGLSPDTDYVLLAEETVQGAFRFWLDGVPMGQAWMEDNPPTKGFVGLLSSGDPGGTGFWWRDISIWAT
jgi:hypothetical protein